MFACTLAELREWMRLDLARSFLISALMLALAGALSSAQPLILLWTYALWAAWFGWSRGNKYRQGSSDWERASADGVSEVQVVCGKLLASSLMFLGMLAAVSPPLILCCVVWGPPPEAIALSGLCWYPLFVLGLAAGLSSSAALDGDEGFLGTVFLVLWFVGTLLVRPLNFLNPFIQAWALLAEQAGLGPWLCAGGTLILGCALLFLALRAVGRIRSKHGR